MRYFAAISILLLVTSINRGAEAQEGPHHAVSGTIVELEGRITKVQVERGLGMPYLEVETGEGPVKVFLGSMRYLMQNNFNPQAGERVKVKGYRGANDFVAASVSLPGQDKTLQLRDKDGRPLWQQGRYGRRGRQIQSEQEGSKP